MLYEPVDIDKVLNKEDKAHRDSVIAADAAFVALMERQIKRGREHVAPGVKVDLTPLPATVRTYRGEPIFSGCGSPAASCAEKGDTATKEIASYV